MNDNQSKSLNILISLINSKANTVPHRYAAQWLLESLIHVLRTVRDKSTDTLGALEEWYGKEYKLTTAFGPRATDKQHVWELAVVANGLSPWWELKPLIVQLESMV
jgi:hypothetical protein